jgi:hypothetical protein
MPGFSSQPPPFDLVAEAGIGGLAVVMAAVVVWLARRYLRLPAARAIGVVAGWMALTAGVAASGLLTRFDIVPPPMAVMIAAVLALSMAIGLSHVGAGLAREVPLHVLVGVQAFRLPLELVMHRAAGLGIMPVELSYSGYNFDIVTGALAMLVFVALRLKRELPRIIIWVFNLWGLWCLAAIVVIAITTSPMVRAFGADPRHVNTWVLYFPYVWLPTVLVIIAMAGHVVLTRALLARRS